MSHCHRCNATTLEEDKFCGTCGLVISKKAEHPELTQKSFGLAEIRYKLGVVYFRKGSYRTACEMFQKILAQDPQHEGATEMLRMARKKV